MGCRSFKRASMGLSSFPTSSDGVLPVIVMNSVHSVTLLKNSLSAFLGVFAAEASRERRPVSVTRFCSLTRSRVSDDKPGFVMECCVCLSGFEAYEEVSELSCRHFFHKGCLDTWFGKNHATCPLCRSVD